MRTLTFSLFAILVLALAARCSRDPVAPDIADRESVQPAVGETTSGLRALIDRLEREGGLTHGQATSLRAHLKNAEKFDERGDSEKADRVFEQMTQQVGKWRNRGQVTAIVADEIITYLQGVLGHKFASISAGGFHSCGVRPTGAAYCWGENQFGQLGNGPVDENSNIPVKVVGGHTFASVSAGAGHTCGVTAPTGRRDPGGTAYCWGNDNHGELGSGPDNDNVESDSPVKVVGGHRFASISAGYDHACGVTTAGMVYCWGDNSYGELGDHGTSGFMSTAPVAVVGGHTFATVSAGSGYTCGVTTAGIGYCWGINDDGQLGNGTNTDSNIPVAVSALRGTIFASITASFFDEDAAGHTCGVTTAGAAYCWGAGQFGQLGNGTTSSSNVPVAVSTGETFSSIEAGAGWTCGVTTGGEGRCWGYNGDGQLGNGSYANSFLPGSVAGAHTWGSISAGINHGCGVTTNKVAYCWGINTVHPTLGGGGQLGDGTTTDSNVPVAVASP